MFDRFSWAVPSLTATLCSLPAPISTPPEAPANPEMAEAIANLKDDCGSFDCITWFEAARDRFPGIVNHWIKDCPETQQLRLTRFVPDRGAAIVSADCWEPVDDRGNRTGMWLGRLPVDLESSTFAPAWTCPEGDLACQTWLPRVKAKNAQQLHRAETHCASLNGTLFFQTIPDRPDAIDLRCGFFSTMLFDEGNNGSVNEMPTSVDISVATFDFGKPDRQPEG